VGGGGGGGLREMVVQGTKVIPIDFQERLEEGGAVGVAQQKKCLTRKRGKGWLVQFHQRVISPVGQKGGVGVKKNGKTRKKAIPAKPKISVGEFAVS